MISAYGTDLLNKTINALPFEVHIPGYQFGGPGTRLAKRLARGDRGVNRLDAACREHDIAYSRSNDLADRHIADRVLAERARERVTANDSTFGEKAAAATVWAVMKAKTKLGMGMKRRKTKRKRILPVTKRGGFLPILPMLGALGSLIGGAASVARAVSDRKAARRQVEGRELYLAPYKRSGGGVKKRMKRRKKNIVEGNARDSENTALRYHDERAIESCGAPFAFTLFQRRIYA
ncbi:hypothetical protein ALC60_05091 [Trachymyrmex zeteki]|uniref:Phospholipase A2-like domain-containing protein n=1 Tax=Mycetomoellerius zeteki TaxID=64791 RepID=A0A151X6K2_9HYME|nr:hypothetical protein ALC60_05091 [Trachymyrmex zeteki]